MNDSPSKVMASTASGAVEYAKSNFDVALDYSEDSVEEVEQILGVLHASRPKGFLAKMLRRGPSRREVQDMALLFGAYIGEVMCRHLGGQWVLESAAAPGQQLLTIRLSDGSEVWPHHKAEKRLINGTEDNVWHYYQVIRSSWQESLNEERTS